MTHLDCSERLLDCAGETLVRSVDPRLLVCGRADLGKKPNFQLIESSSFYLDVKRKCKVSGCNAFCFLYK